jgi:hypothetical protein
MCTQNKIIKKTNKHESTAGALFSNHARVHPSQGKGKESKLSVWVLFGSLTILLLMLSNFY